MDTVKFVDGADDRIEGIAIPYGRDLDGEAFTKDTNLALDWYDSRPLLMQHGQSPVFGLKAVGRVTKVEARDDGLWAEAIIDASERYKARLRQLVQDGHLSFSSGSSGNYTQKATDGTIRAWPFVELSLVPNPANPNAVVAVKEFVGQQQDTGTNGGLTQADVARVVDAALDDRDARRVAAENKAREEAEYRAALADAIAVLTGVDDDTD